MMNNSIDRFQTRRRFALLSLSIYLLVVNCIIHTQFKNGSNVLSNVNIIFVSSLASTGATVPRINQRGKRSKAPITIVKPGRNKDNFNRDHLEEEKIWEQNEDNKIKILSTTEHHLEPVSSILSSSATGFQQKTSGFVASIQLLKAKSAFYQQIYSRWQVLEEAEIATRNGLNHHFDSLTSDDFDIERYRVENIMMSTTSSFENNELLLERLWSNDKFKQKLERASNLTTEPWYVWRKHVNFSIKPSCSSFLQHNMITAVSGKDNNDVVGFCEIFMSASKVPMIANLVVSPQHRRRGIGSQLLSNAIERVEKVWHFPSEVSSTERKIALYVNNDNIHAIQLYQQHGFVKSQSQDTIGQMGSKESNLLYFTKDIS